LPTLQQPAVAGRPWALESLPPFPPIAVRLLRLVNQESISFAEVARLIQADASFSTEVLRLANSALCALRHPVASILQALTVLGTDRLKGVVLTVALRDYVSGAGHHACLRACWRHNLACALLGEWLSETCWIDKGVGYTAGMVHDIGRLALVAGHADEYAHLLEQDLTVLQMLAAEKECFGLDHCQAGEWLARDWQLPDALLEGIRSHHDEAGPAGPDVLNITRISCRLAGEAGFGVPARAGAWSPDWIATALPDFAWNRTQPQLDGLPAQIACKINLFECEFQPLANGNRRRPA
jgi:HD-like signal output (HDOD) protein